uniref:Uncharacterized protein n=1 Tax=Cupriavidus taiwanensis TaxID=164546 RepID=A0A375HG55_9BURK|nr:protein of unknown function [Cupriavidus taiwanensis]
MGQERLQMGGDLLLHALLRPAPTHSSAVKGDADASELSACKSSMRNEARDVLQLMRFPQHSHLAQAMDAYGEAVPRLQSLRSDALHHLIRYPQPGGQVLAKLAVLSPVRSCILTPGWGLAALDFLRRPVS